MASAPAQLSQPHAAEPASDVDLEALDAIQRRVLWLATMIVHHANHVRTNPGKMKIGGHQASSASLVSILTVLYFHYLRSGDRIAIKPHAAPAYHAVQYLLGHLPQQYLTTLRAYKGLQAYPSRTKDPDYVDFSTGSVGLGAVAPAFAALTHHYAAAHFGDVTSDRFVALIGDAELDEGNIWEAVVEQALHGLGNVLWIVDLNRQSLDRVVPGIRAAQLKRLFAESGWQVLEAKYGSQLQHVFAREQGEVLRRRIDDMSNEEYQRLIRMSGAKIRRRFAAGPDGAVLEALLADIPDDTLPGLIGNLGGHDLPELLRAFAQADDEPTRPTVIFAYTIKGWGLPIAGDPLNHAALLTADQIAELAPRLGASLADPWAGFDPESPAGRLCAAAKQRLPITPPPPPQLTPDLVPAEIIGAAPSQSSTQESFGRLLLRLTELPEVGRRIVTTSPDVSVSTNLAGWINKVGVFALSHAASYDDEDQGPRLLKWQPGPAGQHIELGISEMNLFMLLGQLGLSHELCGQLLLPIGTVYDPFICRGLDALIYGLYSGARFIFAGTPSGVTLAPEGGAHQSTITPGLGLTLPQLLMYEPCFALEVEWALLEALRQCCDHQHGRSTYLRLSTRVIDQGLLEPALRRLGKNELRRQVLEGGYRLLEGREACPDGTQDAVYIAASGAVIPEAVAAAHLLQREGVAATVLSLTSPDKLFRSWRDARGQSSHHLATLIPPADRHLPIVTVHDAASHTLAWLGSVYGAPVLPVGVDEFGQSGVRRDLYRHFGLDPEGIADVAFTAVEQFSPHKGSNP